MTYEDIKKLLAYPLNSYEIVKKQRSIKRILLEQNFFINKKIAILSGSTSNDIKNILEVFLLNSGIKPSFYESEYNRYYEESVFPNELLEKFGPDIIFINTSIVNINHLPEVTDDSISIKNKLEVEFSKYKTIWDSLKEQYKCVIIQNNFELPDVKILGNLDSSDIRGVSRYIQELNRLFAEYANKNSNFYINDIHYLSAQIGLDRWHDRNFYYAYKIAFNYNVIAHLTYNIAAIIKGILGRNKKCLVLDLDNTLWGGIIGDVGVDGIEIGKETPLGEAYTEFQKYVLELKKRGVILAICSKNDIGNAKAGFSHPDSILSVEDFSAFKANWEPKHLNIVAISQDLNIGLDSIVFIDDNPVERQIVKENLPEVEVPGIDVNEVGSYIRIINGAAYFETINILQDDLIRVQAYAENRKRKQMERNFIKYEDFLKSLEMQAEIKKFVPIYLERITQLINKSNQFNLTTKRYTLAEIEAVTNDETFITLYGRLKDKYGDNGLVSVIIGKKKDTVLYIELWIMSCRVLKRDMEKAMFDELIKLSKENNIKKIEGYYNKTLKNSIVEDFYKLLGFNLISREGDNTLWQYELVDNVKKSNRCIEIVD